MDMVQGHAVRNEVLLQRLRRQPAIRGRLVALLDVVEDSAGDSRLGDDAEARVTQEIRRMGQDLMQVWADDRVQAREQELRRGGGAHRDCKKNLAGAPRSATSRS
jgi:hypothetical protein